MSHEAVIFDLGGVVLDSPLHAIARYEREIDIPVGHINRVVVETGPRGAWSRLERGEVGMSDFHAAFEAECASAGHAICAADMMQRMSQCGPRPAMLEAIRRLRAASYRVGALTNNWVVEQRDANADEAPLRDAFHVFVESSVVGLRKPDPRIYQLMCERLGTTPERSVFLDDIGRNLKTARALGMATIKVDEPEQALDALAELLGLELR